MRVSVSVTGDVPELKFVRSAKPVSENFIDTVTAFAATDPSSTEPMMPRPATNLVRFIFPSM